MNGVYANGIKWNIKAKSIFCIITYCCFIILFFAYGCAGTSSAIIKAAGSGDIATIKKLCNTGCNINEQDKSGRTPLIQAICAHKTETARFLIESGADLKIKDAYGFDALIFAIDYGHFDIIELLLDKGADIESKDYMGWTPLMHTVNVSGSEKTARLLIKRGANLNAKDGESNTPLSLAIFYKNPGLAAEFKKAIASGSKDAPSVKIVFIRESNVLIPGELQDVLISIDERVVNLRRNSTDSIDVSPGKCTIVIKGSRLEGDNITTFDTKAGQTYYLLVSRRVGSIVGGSMGLVGQVVESQAKGEKAGPFEITPLEESVAKEKIQILLKTNK